MVVRDPFTRSCVAASLHFGHQNEKNGYTCRGVTVSISAPPHSVADQVRDHKQSVPGLFARLLLLSSSFIFFSLPTSSFSLAVLFKHAHHNPNMSFFKKLTDEFKELKANFEDKPKEEKKKEEVVKPAESSSHTDTRSYGDQSHIHPHTSCKSSSSLLLASESAAASTASL
jgi:hypothetical protein